MEPSLNTINEEQVRHVDFVMAPNVVDITPLPDKPFGAVRMCSPIHKQVTCVSSSDFNSDVIFYLCSLFSFTFFRILMLNQ